MAAVASTDAALAAGNAEDAETYAQIAIGRDPAFVPARLALGRALEAQARHPEAAATYAEAARMAPLGSGVRTSIRRVWLAPIAGFGVVYAVAIVAFRELGRRFDQRTVLLSLLVLTLAIIVWTLVFLGRRRRRFASLSADDRRILEVQGSGGLFAGLAAGRFLAVGAVMILLSGAAVVFAVGQKASLQMRVGDCFTLDRRSSIEQIAAIPCELPHGTEVIGIFTYPEPAGAGYPGVEAARGEAMPFCTTAYQAYVGIAYPGSNVYWLSAMVPEQSYWDVNVRSAWCTVVDMQLRQTSGSARGTAK
jgi:hypothetical protein